jgi:hypothetical protein
MNKFITLQNGSILTGVGLIGLALSNLSNGDYASAVSNVLAALAAFGVSIGSANHVALMEQHNLLKNRVGCALLKNEKEVK